MASKLTQALTVSSRAQKLTPAVATPKQVLPATARAEDLAAALTKSSLNNDLPQKQGKKKKASSTLAAMIQREHGSH